jgi:hypothetical protein
MLSTGERFTNRPHPVWSLLKCTLLINLLGGVVTCAYNIQIGMGIVTGTVILMVIGACLRIIGVCPDRTILWYNSAEPVARRERRTPAYPIEKQEYILVSNPDLSISIGTRAFPSQPPANQYPPPY